MNDRVKKRTNKAFRQARTRSQLHGTDKRPRMCVNISSTNISVQLINDDSSTTLVSASSIGQKLSGTMIEKSALVGETVAKLAVKKKINYVVFDRGAKKYHGRIKAVADAARKNGLEF